MGSARAEAMAPDVAAGAAAGAAGRATGPSGEGGAALERRISFDHRLQRLLVAAVAAVAVGMVAPDQVEIALPQCPTVRIDLEAEDAQRLAVALAELAPVLARLWPPRPEA